MRITWYRLWPGLQKPGPSLFLVQVFILLLAIPGLQAQICTPVEISGQFESVNLKPYTKIFPADEDLPADTVFSLIREGKITGAKPGFRQYIWIFFCVQNPDSVSKDLVLDIRNGHIEYYEFYRVDPDSFKAQEIASGGSKFPFHSRSHGNRRFIEHLSVEPLKDNLFMIKIDDRERQTALSFRLMSNEEFNSREASENLFFNLYFGGLFFIGMFSLVLGYILRFTVFYAYGIYALVMAFFMFVNQGFGFKFIYPGHPEIEHFLDVLLIVPLLFSFTMFAGCYFRLREENKRLYRMVLIHFTVLGTALLFWLVTGAGLAMQYYIYLNYILISATYLLLTLIALKSLKRRRTRSVFFLMAFAVLAISGAIFALIDAAVLPQEWFFTNPLLLGSIIEFGIFTLALVVEVKRINETKNRLLAANAEQQKQILNAYVEGAEKERTRISGELHDNIASRLALLKNRIAAKVEADDEIVSDVSDLYRNIRSLSHELSPGDFHVISLDDYLRIYLQKFEEISSIKVKYVSGGIPRLNANTSGQLFRIVQEAAQNAHKHSRATGFEVQLIGHPNELVLTIDDNGEGFEPGENSGTGSRGIFNMRIRVETLGGTFELSSAKQKGTHIIISIPLTESQ